MKIVQQGDVVMKSINDFPEGERVQDQQMKSKILAFGEVTGHAHRLADPEDLAVETFRILNVIYMNVKRPTMLNHEEHNTIEIPPGKYEIGIVRETDHFAGITRQVAD
jgi:hypothetical protein